MEVKRLERLVKCLELLASDQDGEVLNAARMVAKIAKEEKLVWANAIKVTIDVQKSQIEPQSYASPYPTGGLHDIFNQSTESSLRQQAYNSAYDFFRSTDYMQSQAQSNYYNQKSNADFRNSCFNDPVAAENVRQFEENVTKARQETSDAIKAARAELQKKKSWMFRGSRSTTPEQQ